MSKYTLVQDSSQVACWLECEQLWDYQYNKRLVMPNIPHRTDDPRDVGTYGHRILDLYYKLRASGVDYLEATSQALSYNPDTDTCECGCLADCHKYIATLDYTECQKCHKCLHAGKELTYAPFPLEERLRTNVRERLRLYFPYWHSNDYKPINAQHVEVGFSEVLYEDSENLFVIEGRIDLIGTLQGLPCIVDHKFQLSRKDLYPKSIQFKTYALVNKSLMLIINYVRLAQKVEADVTFKRTIVNFTVPELLRWKQELVRVFFSIKQAKERSSFERRWNACGGFQNRYFCYYTPLCEEYNNDTREVKERQLYTISKNPWRPW